MAGGVSANRLLQWVPACAASLGLGAAGVAGLPLISPAQEAEPVADLQIFERLMAVLQEGNHEEALAMISSVETLTGEPHMVSSRAQFVDLVLGCPSEITQQRPFGRTSVLLTVEWQCASGLLTGVLTDNGNGRYVVVADMADETLLASRAAERPRFSIPPPSPPPPMRRPQTAEERAAAGAAAARLDVERSELLNAVGAAVSAGTPDAIADRVLPTANFTYGFRDPFNSTNINDLQGQGLDAAREQFARSVADMGTPTSFACEPGRTNVCRWQFGSEPKGLLALIFERGGQISAMQLIYITPETVERAARNATPEQLEAYAASLREGK
jgi:hypothetical protein